MVQTEPHNIVERFFNTLGAMLDGPLTYVKEKIVAPNQQSYPWYHQKFRRVPTIDECYDDDVVCFFEANAQYRRDRQVDSEILNILRQRFEDCVVYEAPDILTKCAHVLKEYQENETNWFIKYGDLGAYHDAKKAYMKQKHRMIWERRHGPVGSGKKEDAVQE